MIPPAGSFLNWTEGLSKKSGKLPPTGCSSQYRNRLRTNACIGANTFSPGHLAKFAAPEQLLTHLQQLLAQQQWQQIADETQSRRRAQPRSTTSMAWRWQSSGAWRKHNLRSVQRTSRSATRAFRSNSLELLLNRISAPRRSDGCAAPTISRRRTLMLRTSSALFISWKAIWKRA